MLSVLGNVGLTKKKDISQISLLHGKDSIILNLLMYFVDTNLTRTILLIQNGTWYQYEMFNIPMDCAKFILFSLKVLDPFSITAKR